MYLMSKPMKQAQKGVLSTILEVMYLSLYCPVSSRANGLVGEFLTLQCGLYRLSLCLRSMCEHYREKGSMAR